MKEKKLCISGNPQATKLKFAKFTTIYSYFRKLFESQKKKTPSNSDFKKPNK